MIAHAATAQSGTGYRLPHFRQTVSPEPVVTLSTRTTLRLLADADFPPYSFRAAQDNAAGLAVDLALSACTELKVTCTVQLLPFAELLPAFQRGEGDVLVDGPQLTETTLGDGLPTRPWFRSLGRFAVLSGNPLTEPSMQNLAGKRIGVEQDSAHAAWLAKYYGDFTMVAFATLTAAREALRSGAVDALFGDDLRLIYWVAGTDSHGCCKLVGGAYTDFATFSHNQSFVVKPGDDELRGALDAALDRLQDKGITEKLFNAYVPLNPW